MVQQVVLEIAQQLDQEIALLAAQETVQQQMVLEIVQQLDPEIIPQADQEIQDLETHQLVEIVAQAPVIKEPQVALVMPVVQATVV